LFVFDVLLDFRPSLQSGRATQHVTLRRSSDANQLIQRDESSLAWFEKIQGRLPFTRPPLFISFLGRVRAVSLFNRHTSYIYKYKDLCFFPMSIRAQSR
jgi:hypothetical protein